MNPYENLKEIIVKETEEQIKESKNVELGKIDPAYSSGKPSIVFDGENQASVKQYPYLNSYQPVANDRVEIVRGVVLGKITTTDNSAQTLWEGAYYMNETQTITPTKAITDCANGWILVWSDFDEPTSTPKPYQWVQTYLHKSHLVNHSGESMYVSVAQFYNSIVAKEIVPTATTITGSSNNATNTDMKDVVLREVHEW